MRIEYAFKSTEGSARENNEDSVGIFLPDAVELWRSHGALVVLADGMGGQVRGEVASRMVCDKMVESFTAAAAMTAPEKVLQDAVRSATLAVYDDNMNHHREWGKMATTLTASVFRNDEVTVAHVGDCRVYLIQQSAIRQLTTDHSYAATQLKLGLITLADAAESAFRSVLTRSIGNDPFVRADIITAKVGVGDVIVQCCDGLWSKVTDWEILAIAGKHTPEDACAELIRLAEKRFADDNLTVQVVRISDIERLSNYRGPAYYWKESDGHMGEELETGQTLDARYRITEIISKSGMATIYKAADLTDEKTVALKVPFLRFESDPGFFSRFEREQKIGHTLSHRYVLHLLDTPDQSKSRPYMVMEYLEGQTLGQLMAAVNPMPVNDALEITARICEGLQYLHENNVVHRDLKPDNIMLCKDGTIRIMDFGIAKYDGQRRLTFGGFTPTMGTPDYMAPEQVRGKRGDKRTDLYSLGIILFEMVTGKTPFQGENPFIIMNSRITGDPPAPRQFNAAITPQVEEIILHATARQPEDRYQDAAEMHTDLVNPNDVKVTGRVHRLVEPNVFKTSWRKWRVMSIAIGVPLLIVLGFWLHKHVQFK
jgi:serine/threonine protein phosphatase PrpC